MDLRSPASLTNSSLVDCPSVVSLLFNIYFLFRFNSRNPWLKSSPCFFFPLPCSIRSTTIQIARDQKSTDLITAIRSTDVDHWRSLILLDLHLRGHVGKPSIVPTSTAFPPSHTSFLYVIFPPSNATSLHFTSSQRPDPHSPALSSSCECITSN